MNGNQPWPETQPREVTERETIEARKELVVEGYMKAAKVYEELQSISKSMPGHLTRFLDLKKAAKEKTEAEERLFKCMNDPLGTIW